ncbi:MAG: efflux RND transporter periplasmic adaptor subunit [bacterium]|nr:efflux RND transporter periplasmic adaptor subunit [bacterium]
MKPAGRRLVIPLLLVVIALVFGVRGLLIRNTQGPVKTIEGNGVIEATEVNVSSEIASRILSVDVKEGQDVRQGQLIAVLDGGQLDGQVEQARGNLTSAEASLKDLQAGSRPEEIRRMQAQYEAARRILDQARARRDLVRAGSRPEQIGQLRAVLTQAQVRLDEAQKEYTRIDNLMSAGAVSRQAADQAAAARDAARAQVAAAREQLAMAQAGARPQELREAEAAVGQAQAQVSSAGAALDLALAGPRRETVTAARGQVDQAQGALNSTLAKHQQTRVYAPSNGRVTLRSLEPGEVASPGAPIIRMADLRHVWLRVYVPETQIGLLKTGQRADVTVDSYPGRIFHGKVVEIAQEPEFTPKNVQTREERIKLVFGVKVAVENPAQDLKPGMPADAVIYLDRYGVR